MGGSFFGVSQFLGFDGKPSRKPLLWVPQKQTPPFRIPRQKLATSCFFVHHWWQLGVRACVGLCQNRGTLKVVVVLVVSLPHSQKGAPSKTRSRLGTSEPEVSHGQQESLHPSAQAAPHELGGAG